NKPNSSQVPTAAAPLGARTPVNGIDKRWQRKA
ncbi:hypothetical protein CCACVL1_02090, partial [Corchorus capsularis]